MSYILSVIIVYRGHEYIFDGIDKEETRIINEFKVFDNQKLNSAGEKVMQGSLFTGAFRCMPPDDFIEKFLSLKWEGAVLLVNDEHWDYWKTFEYKET
jgi:hypothetical protein